MNVHARAPGCSLVVVLLVVKLRGCAVGYFNDTPDLREEGLRRVVVGYALWKLCPRTAAILQVQVCNTRIYSIVGQKSAPALINIRTLLTASHPVNKGRGRRYPDLSHCSRCGSKRMFAAASPVIITTLSCLLRCRHHPYDNTGNAAAGSSVQVALLIKDPRRQAPARHAGTPAVVLTCRC